MLYITTEEVEVCEEAWWNIHGLLRSTYMAHKQSSNAKHVPGHAKGSIAAIV